MGNLLFNPNGRIGRNRFWQGMVILTVLTVLIAAASAMINPFLGILNLAMVYLYVCVYGKRLHDYGTTAWWVIGVWVASIIVGFILNLILGPFFIDEEAILIQQEMIERMQSGDSEGMVEGMRIFSMKVLPLTLLSGVATNAILGAAIGFLKTEQRENKHGPVPGWGAGDTFG
ncbi:MAG: hypothetical protein Hens3KO_03350 [Henriciella sp.]